MATVTVSLPHHHYSIKIEPGLLNQLGDEVRTVAPHDRAALIADATVMQLHGEQAVAALHAAEYKIAKIALPSGEKHKTLDTVKAAYDIMLDARLERRSPVIAFGGGVCGDTAGFVAATYLRGVPFIQCPTTLLAMVDASVGGKVGVNVKQGKNLIGAFYQPQLVLIDPLVLRTLPKRELRCGLAECIKHGVIRDPELFSWIEDHVSDILALDTDTMVELVQRNVAIKAAVVEADEKESGVRAHLNFGHTFAHAIEAEAGYGEIEHGEAVSLGMVAATSLAVETGMCDRDLLTRLIDLLDAIGLPTLAELPPSRELMASMTLDKKVENNKIRLVLPTRLGEVTICDDKDAIAIAKAWKSIRAESGE